MALPTVVASNKTFPAGNFHLGPFISSGGDIYVVINDPTTGSQNIEVWKATDPTDSFAEQDSGNVPTVDNSHRSAWVVQDSDILRIITVEVATTVGVEYHDFNMADDTWGTKNETVQDFSGQNPPGLAGLASSITLRGTGDPIVVLHTDNEDKFMGVNYGRIAHSTRSGGGSWTNRGLAFGTTSTEINYLGASSVRGTSDNTHFMTTQDVAGAGTTLFGRTLDSSNVLSTTVDNADPTNTDPTLVKAVTYDDSGTQRIFLPFNVANLGQLSIWRMTEDGSGDLADDADDTINVSDASNDVVNSVIVGASIAIDGTTAHMIWGDDTDFDIYHDEAGPPQGTSDWGIDVEERDGVTAKLFSGNIINRSGTKFAFIYHAAGGSGDVTYDELDLAGVAPQLQNRLLLLGVGI